jgi:hypothetical protein
MWRLFLSFNPPPAREDGERSSFRNLVFSIYLEFQTMDKVQKHGDFESHKLFGTFCWDSL